MLLDTHAHIMVPEFDGDRSSVIQRARDAGVVGIVAIGMNLETSLAAISLAESFAGVFATVGLHPGETGNAGPSEFDEISELATHEVVVGIGETGLDYYWDKTGMAHQQLLFRQHVELARRVGKPVVVHDRDAHDDVLTVLEEERAAECGAILHCFTGDTAMASKAASAGYFISFGGIVTFKNTTLSDVVRAVPAENLLIETDSPYLSPHPFRGKRNEPARLVHVADTVGSCRNLTREEVADVTFQNARNVFSLPG